MEQVKILILPNGQKKCYTVRWDRARTFKRVWTAWFPDDSKIIVQCDWPWNIRRELVKSWLVMEDYKQQKIKKQS